MKKIKTIDITALEWFDKTNGNSYFAATVSIDYGLPTEQSFTIPFQYGYGEHYLQVAQRQLIKRKLFPPTSDLRPLTQYCRDRGIVLNYRKQENCKKRELMRLV